MPVSMIMSQARFKHPRIASHATKTGRTQALNGSVPLSDKQRLLIRMTVITSVYTCLIGIGYCIIL